MKHSRHPFTYGTVRPISLRRRRIKEGHELWPLTKLPLTGKCVHLTDLLIFLPKCTNNSVRVFKCEIFFVSYT